MCPSQWGQVMPAMFSTTPATGRPRSRQNRAAFSVSSSATACGVVTSRARVSTPSSRSQMVISSLPVPGGMSMTRKSSVPQS